ncbi:LysR family transcriptional regulator [Lampropedia cohaerens]|uniref:LysR family transcriptional regulator n=1 Tax=Lampropedia cohaerens TaxID=1610491 RepID=A0A0U1PY17_9BURK|nr:LysR family transcriptional regulator [Lampropedia cohaerens]KKW67357.1 LysR family transcriptional regulator [Lampropedia cohaerens]
MHDLNDFYYYAQVIEHGGFAAAGRALGLPKSKLSRRVAALEARLGVRLIQRSTRRFVVTDVGQRFHAHCKAMLVEAEAAEAAVLSSRAEPAGVVRMSCPTALLQAQVAHMVADFMVAYPAVQVHLEDTNRRVDVVGEGIDVALRVRPAPLEDSDLVLRVLGQRSQCLVASPQLLATHGTPMQPADLAALPSLALGQPQFDYHWHLIGPDGQHHQIAHQPRLVTRSMPALLVAAEAGVGVVQLPRMMMHDALARGALVQVMPGWEPPAEIVHAVLPSRRYLLPAVRALVDDLAQRFSALQDQ